MALEIFKLVGSIFVDTDEAEKSISKADEKATGLGKTLLNGVGTAAKWAAGIAAGAGVAATAMFGVATNTATAMDEIDKGSEKIGISKQAYQEWSYVLGQNGMDIDKLETGMKTLVSQMDSAANGTASATENFDALGVSIYDSTGKLKDQETILNEAMYALANMENGTEKARLATELFGKAGVEMMPMLNGGAAGMEELTQRAHELGLVMSDEAVNAGVVMGDTLDDVKKSVGALGNQLGASFIPIIMMVLTLILDNLPVIQGMFGQLAPVLTSLLSGLIPPLLELAQKLLPLILDLISAIVPVAVQIVEAVLPILVALLDVLLPPIIELVQLLLPPLLELLIPILNLLQPIIELLKPILDLVVGLLTPLASLISDLLTPLISVISKVISVALVPLQAAFTVLSGLLSGAVNGAFSLVTNAVNTIKNVFSGVTTFLSGVFTGNWKKAWSGISQIFSSIWEGIKTAFKIPINFIIDGINAFIRGINKLKIPDWVPAVGGRGFSIKEIPRLEHGGVLERGQVGLLEGNGAEAVVPLHKNQAWISAVAEDMERNGIGGGSNSKVEALLLAILDLLEELGQLGIYLDTGALVGGLAKPMDKKLGQLQAAKARG